MMTSTRMRFVSLVFIACLMSLGQWAGPLDSSRRLRGRLRDSITEQRLYSVFIEDYLLMCQPVADLKATQFAGAGEGSGLPGPYGQ